MNKSFLMMACVAFCMALLVACNTNAPDQRTVNPLSCRDVILTYFPYSIDEHFVFENDLTKERKVLDAYSQDGKTYPSVSIHGASSSDSVKSHGDWEVLVYAHMIAEDNVLNGNMLGYQSGYINFTVKGSAYNKKCLIGFYSPLILNKNEQYYGYTSSYIDTAEAFSLFTDTITIPLLSQSKPTRVVLPEGACVHIVKNKGITDFSLDGNSVWRRVF